LKSLLPSNLSQGHVQYHRAGFRGGSLAALEVLRELSAEGSERLDLPVHRLDSGSQALGHAVALLGRLERLEP
jgi:hypothetical protein